MVVLIWHKVNVGGAVFAAAAGGAAPAAGGAAAAEEKKEEKKEESEEEEDEVSYSTPAFQSPQPHSLLVPASLCFISRASKYLCVFDAALGSVRRAEFWGAALQDMGFSLFD